MSARDYRTITRYAITKVNKNGMRTLAFANQGRHHFDTEDAAYEMLRAITGTNSLETLHSVYGDIKLMEVRPVECYEHGDAIGIYFND
jgi:hypothetical protein